MNLNGFNISYEFNKCPYNCNSRGNCENSKCNCKPGYTEQEEGKPGLCQNGGVCRNSRCSCTDNYHGDTCDAHRGRSVWDRIPTHNDVTGRASHASVIIDDAIWSIGGERFSGVEFEDPVVYNITSRSWTTIAVEGDLQPAARFDHTLVRYKMRLYMFGGVIDRRNITSELWSFDLHSREWRKEGSDNNDLMAPAPSEVNSGGSQELLQQLSTFESESDSDFEEIPKKRGRGSGVREAFLEEQTRYIRAKRLYLEKKYALLSKWDSLFDKIQINVNLQPCEGGEAHILGRRTTKTDPNIEESLLSTQV